MTSGIAPGSISPEDATQLACFNLLRMVGQLTEASSGSGGKDAFGPLVGVAQALALIIEQSPENATPGAMRKTVDQFADLVKGYTKAYRRTFEETGVHPIAAVLTQEEIAEGVPSWMAVN